MVPNVGLNVWTLLFFLNMDHFVVSARKYRPTGFSAVLGQSHITTTLKNAIKSDHLAHAYLFCGPRGVGKTTCARILAKTINCQQRTANVEACNACPSCVNFNQQASLNIYELDAASNNSVEDVRNLVDQVRYAPQSGRFKIYIIDEVHMLSQAAFNAFLKTLEEPPKHAIFILATTERHKVLPTIISRCQLFDFQKINPNDIVKQLKAVAENEEIGYEEEALHLISQKSDGALRDALSMFDVIVSFGAGKITYRNALDNLHILDYSYFFQLTDAFLKGDVAACLLTYEAVSRSGFDGLYFLEGLMGHFRNLLVAQNQLTVPLLEVPPTLHAKYHETALALTNTGILKSLQMIAEFGNHFKESIHKRFHVELLLIELASILRVVDNQKREEESPVSNSPNLNKEPATPEEKKTTPVADTSIEKAGPTEEKKTTPVADNAAPMEKIPSIEREKKASSTSHEASTIGLTINNIPLQDLNNEHQKNDLSATSEKKIKIGQASMDTQTENAKEQTTATNKLKSQIPRSNLASTIKVPTLKEIKSNIEQQKKTLSHQEKKTLDDTLTDSSAKKAIDPILLKQHWQAYAMQLKAEKRLAAYNFLSQGFHLTDKHTIVVHYSNTMEETIFQEIKEPFTNYLRQQFNLEHLSLQAVFIKCAETMAKPYTMQEKFQYLATKNPFLQQLKETLQLDLID